MSEKPVSEITDVIEAKREFLNTVEALDVVKARYLGPDAPLLNDAGVERVYGELMGLYVRMERLDDRIDELTDTGEQS